MSEATNVEREGGSGAAPGSAARTCEWLYNFRGYGCSSAAEHQLPCLMENGSLKIWSLCDVHKQEAERMLKEALALPPNDPSSATAKGNQ